MGPPDCWARLPTPSFYQKANPEEEAKSLFLMQLRRGRKSVKRSERERDKVECETTMIRPQKIIQGGPRDSLAV
ncbi:hypothetical protein ALC57_08771 [Trachymyrmex cornetzi]|uniref:Uncharacterized protein n=1 Tax=Trachymyrmex cornetzi TaxID=471704 RepID=A0A195E1B9_9HYME|nr:hypothetical protein ALC57_08771 [Trachymyrmex cornetzi]